MAAGTQKQPEPVRRLVRRSPGIAGAFLSKKIFENIVTGDSRTI